MKKGNMGHRGVRLELYLGKQGTCLSMESLLETSSLSARQGREDLSWYEDGTGKVQWPRTNLTPHHICCYRRHCILLLLLHVENVLPITKYTGQSILKALTATPLCPISTRMLEFQPPG